MRTTAILMCCWVGAMYLQGSDPAQALIPTEHNPLYLQFLRPGWQPLSRENGPRFTFGTAGFYANMFERRSNDRYSQDFDNEMASAEFYGQWRPTRQLTFTARMGFHRFSGGFLDGAIQDFHSTFGLPNDDRGEVEDQRFALELIDRRRGTLFSAEPYRWYAGSPQVSGSWTFASSSAWDWALGGTLKIPWGDAPFAGDHPDAGLDLHGRRAWNRWRFDFQAGVLSIQAEKGLASITRDAAAYGMIWVERRWWRHTRTFVQIDGATAYFQGTGLDSLDPATVNLYLGLAQPLDERWSFVMTFGEDLTARGPSLDFSVNIGCQVAF